MVVLVIFIIFLILLSFFGCPTSLYNITTVTEHLKRQPTLQAMIENQISKQWLIFIDLKRQISFFVFGFLYCYIQQWLIFIDLESCFRSRFFFFFLIILVLLGNRFREERGTGFDFLWNLVLNKASIAGSLMLRWCEKRRGEGKKMRKIDYFFAMELGSESARSICGGWAADRQRWREEEERKWTQLSIENDRNRRKISIKKKRNRRRKKKIKILFK